MSPTPILFCTLLFTSIISCTSTTNNQIEEPKNINEQLNKLNTLLRDSAFAVSLAVKQDSAYQGSQNQGTTPLPPTDSMIKKSYKQEKIAINLAGFLATECGIGALMEQNGGTPVDWLKKIVNKDLDAGSILLLNRFANATWKASQPFRGLSRITRDNFIVANFLSEEETKKDYDQVMAAASKLLDTLKNLNDASKENQLQMISRLMKNKQYDYAMAKHIEASYYMAQNKQAPAFVSAPEDTAVVDKSAFEEQIAIKIAGFYALECGLSYLAAAENKLPLDVLKSIADDSITQKDKRLLERFANATWKAGQAFRSLDRIERDSFTPFSPLSEEEIEKDWVQIKAAAAQVLKSF